MNERVDPTTSWEFVCATSASACLCLIGGQGIERILAGEMEVQEMAKFQESAEVLHDIIAQPGPLS